jgi:hypothetical protein
MTLRVFDYESEACKSLDANGRPDGAGLTVFMNDAGGKHDLSAVCCLD